jgi:hypothetical protein
VGLTARSGASDRLFRKPPGGRQRRLCRSATNSRLLPMPLPNDAVACCPTRQMLQFCDIKRLREKQRSISTIRSVLAAV